MKSLTPASLIRFLLIVGVALSPFATLSVCAQAATNTADDATLSYTIMLTDRLRIAVYQEEDLSVIARVDATGAVNLPLVGQVNVKGLTVREAQNVIEGAYKEGRYLRSPQVTINVEEYAAREVTIQGEVRSPGRYPLPIESTMTVLELVTKAGGFTDTAKGTAVVVSRILKDGTKKSYTVDVQSVIKGKEKATAKDAGLVLQPGDVVFVGQRII